jgi:hypothetical protein
MYKLLKVANIGDKSQYIIVEYVMEIYWEKLDENLFVSYRISNRSIEGIYKNRVPFLEFPGCRLLLY